MHKYFSLSEREEQLINSGRRVGCFSFALFTNILRVDVSSLCVLCSINLENTAILNSKEKIKIQKSNFIGEIMINVGHIFFEVNRTLF